MAKLIKIYKATDDNGKEVQHAIYDAGDAFEIYRWDEAKEFGALVERFPYIDGADRCRLTSDRKAALAMAKGNAKSRSDNVEFK